MSLPDMFFASVARRGTATMLDFLGRRYSYDQVADGVRRVGKGLRDLGIGPGDRIGLFLPNVPHYVAAYYGALSIGATVVNFSPLYTAAELADQVADSGTRLIFTVSATALLPTAIKVLENSALERLVVGSVAGVLPPAKSVLYRLFRSREVAPRPHDPRIVAFSALIDNDGAGDPATIDPDKDVALIQYTGGTTGWPKGAMLSHQNLTANARQVQAVDPQPDAEDRIMGVLPFFHVFANTCVLNRTVVRGGAIVMLPRFEAKQVLAAIGRMKPNGLPGVPTMFQALMDHPDFATTNWKSLRICISGGAPLPGPLCEKFEKATGVRLVEGYGLTESSGVVSANPYIGPRKVGTIGQPIPATQVLLLDKEDPTALAPDGEPGELAIRGPQVMRGYWNRPESQGTAFAEINAEAWLRTGDVATIDEDGFVTIVDRLKDMIAVGGFKVFPSQVEEVLLENPAIKEVLVIGVPDAYKGEVPRAYVTLADGAGEDGEALKAWLNARVGKHERVDSVVVRAALPKTMIGKLDRKALRAEVL